MIATYNNVPQYALHTDNCNIYCSVLTRVRDEQFVLVSFSLPGNGESDEAVKVVAIVLATNVRSTEATIYT